MKPQYLRINTNLIQTNIYSELKTSYSTPLSKPTPYSTPIQTPMSSPLLKTSDIHEIYEIFELYRNHIDFDSYIKSIDELLVNINELQYIEKNNIKNNIFLEFSHQIKKNDKNF